MLTSSLLSKIQRRYILLCGSLTVSYFSHQAGRLSNAARVDLSCGASHTVSDILRALTVAATAVDVPHHIQAGPLSSSEFLGASWSFVPRARLSGPFVESGGGGRSGREEREKDPWYSSRNWPHRQAQNYMSQELSAAGSSTQRVTSSQEPSTNAATTSAYPYGSSGTLPLSGTNPPGGHVHSAGLAVTDSPGYYRPPLSPTGASIAGIRSLGVQSILNPAQPEPESGNRNLHNASGQLTIDDHGQEADASRRATVTSPRSRKRNPRSLRVGRSSDHAQILGTRQTLTPISPARRAEGLGVRRSLTGPSSTTQPISLAPAGARVYTAELGTRQEADIPPLPTAPYIRGTAQDPQSGESSSGPTRTYGGGYALARDFGSIARKSESPGTSQSSYSYVSQPSPIFTHGRTVAPHYGVAADTPTTSQASQGFNTSHYLEGHRHHPPGQTSLQMTLNTEQGTMVVPVDVQQASKTANEKRKRNASASARFRARRKEKEKEASHTIVNLETELREAMEDRDHYRNERDFFRDLASRHMDLSQLPQRPVSPALRRAAPLLPPVSVEPGSAQFQESYRDPTESSSRAPLRRRTGDRSRMSESSMSASPMLPPQSLYPSQMSAQPLSLPPVPLPPTLPNPFLEGRPRPSTAQPASFPQLSRSQSHDPFRPERYDRNWDPSRG